VSDEIAEWMRQALEHHRAGRLEEAAAVYTRIVAERPAHREAPIRLAEVLEALGRLEEAIALFEEMVRRSPDAAGLLCGLADALHAQGDRPRAIDAYRRAVALDSSLEAAWWGLGCALSTMEDHAPAAESFRRLTAIRPGHGLAWHNLGQSLFVLGEVDRAIEAFRTAADHLNPEAIGLALGNIAVAIPGSAASDNQGILDARRTWAAHCLPASPPDKTRPGHGTGPGRPLRLGYVSAFFAKRNWMKPVWGLLDHHDRDQFEVHVFSDGPEPDPKHGYRKQPSDSFQDVTGLSNAELARLIEDHAIDILVDLNAYSRPGRLPLYARRPAPVQVAWFNMFATSGMTCVDYLVGDAHVIPPEEEAFYTERVVRVPGCYLTFQVPYAVPDVAPAPCRERGCLTFGCLAPQYKITTEVIEAWSRILIESPETRLVLKNAVLGQIAGRDWVRARFAQLGIAEDRLDLAGPDEHFAFLARYGDIDVALDTFPYNGGTTTMESLWQGVPVLTFAGDRWAARISAAMLREAGLAEFVAPDRDGFVAQAIQLAGDPDTPARLDVLRRSMRDRLRAASVCDVATFTRNMEELYLRMWQECQDGDPYGPL
jgi:predicted O-linked N-acetylglucosamine transferase (SPINDLY family)